MMSKGELKAPTQRQLRVGEELRHALAQLLERGEVRDPRLADTPITVTEVRVSADLRNATVFFIPLGGGADDTVVNALMRARGFMRRRLAELVRLRTTPALTFRFDPSFDEAGHIEALLRHPAVARDLAHDDNGEDDAANAGGEPGGDRPGSNGVGR